jgi:hypothetical protein
MDIKPDVAVFVVRNAMLNVERLRASSVLLPGGFDGLRVGAEDGGVPGVAAERGQWLAGELGEGAIGPG